MKDAIGYLRVSTREQGRSGLGLAAQRHDIETFGARERFSIKFWYQDIQTGKGKDALLLRPGLAAALKEARAARCPLIVSKLDRLSRNVHFITGLMEHKVHFVVAALGRDCDEFTLHIYASLAEQERKMISERCKASAAALMRKGKKFGLAVRSKAWRRRVSALGRASLIKAAMERAEAYRLHIEWAFRQPSVDGSARPISFRAAASRDLDPEFIQSELGELLRMAASINDGYGSATFLLERFGSAARNSRLHRAGTQWEQWWDSVYLCDYAAQPPFRRSVNRILVRGESVHQLERVIHAGPIRVDRGRRRDEKVMISGALTLLTNAVIAYNTWKLHQVLERSREAGRPVPSDAILAHVAPIAFRHINFQGIYRFPLERYLDRLLPSLVPGQKIAAGAK